MGFAVVYTIFLIIQAVLTNTHNYVWTINKNKSTTEQVPMLGCLCKYEEDLSTNGKVMAKFFNETLTNDKVI